MNDCTWGHHLHHHIFVYLKIWWWCPQVHSGLHHQHGPQFQFTLMHSITEMHFPSVRVSSSAKCTVLPLLHVSIVPEKDSSGPTAKAGKESATKTKSATKQHRKSSIDDPPPAVTARSSETGSPPRKKQKLSDPSREESPSHIKLPKNISNQCIVQFTVFCQKRRESVKNEHPDYDDSQVEDCLQEQWSKLDDETRSRFIPMGSDFTYLSQMMASVGMPKGQWWVVYACMYSFRILL